jgi:tetratricopeptide (TPR) repeat protein
LGFEAATSYTNLGETIYATEGPAKQIELFEAAVEFALGRGLMHHVWWTKVSATEALYDLGRWDDALRLCEEVIAWDRDHGGSQMEVLAAQAKTLIQVWRGELSKAIGFLENDLKRSRSIGDVQTLAPALMIAALIEEQRGEAAAARRHLEELDEVTRDAPAWRLILLTATARTGAAVGAIDLATRHTDEADNRTGRASPYSTSAIATARAVLAEARSEFDQAADFYREAVAGWREFGIVLEHAGALLGLGRAQVALGRFDEAAPALTEARELFARLGAGPLIADTDALLERTTAAAS